MWNDKDFEFFMEHVSRLNNVSHGEIKEIVIAPELHNFLMFQLQRRTNSLASDISSLYGIKISKESKGIPEAPKLFSRTDLWRIKDALLICATLTGDKIKAKHFEELFEKLTHYLESTTQQPIGE